MATLVLSTVGTMLGGPIGGAIGSLLGQGIDQQLFGSGPRHGPRVGDLSVQTSSYGTQIPRIYGTMRVAGSIIWSTDLAEASHTEGAKGQPETVTYSYSASFAVALSSREVTSVRRIWADGKLIRTAGGEFTVPTSFRISSGSEDQAVDPLIATIEGIDSTPAYRGLALAVFEDLQLAEFGNRIPFLTFEVEADPGDAGVDEILADVSDGAIAATSRTTLRGYAAHGTSVVAAIEPLVELCGIPLFDDGSVLASPSPHVAVVSDLENGCALGAKTAPRQELTQTPARAMPQALALSYYDSARDYQVGSARASFDSQGGSVERVELPAVLESGAAKALSESTLGRRWAERDRLTLHLPPKYVALRPGALVEAPSFQNRWRAEAITLDGLVVRAELRPLHSTFDSVPADAGRVLPSEGVVPAPTNVELMELPDDGTGLAAAPVVVVAAASTSPTWRAVPLAIELAGTIQRSRTADLPAIMGAALTSLPQGQPAVLDLVASVDVELVTTDSWLESCDDEALVAGTNLALLGNELIQFGDVLPLGDGRFRLSRLLRGRRGSEWSMGQHNAGERFVVLDPGRLRPVSLTIGHTGSTVRVTPRGLADVDAAPAELAIVGEAMRPPSPVHLRAAFDADGDLHCSWVRRSKVGWAWLDGVEAPLGCSAERYRVALRNAGALVEAETLEPMAQFTPAQLAGLGSGLAELTVVQVGDFATSRAASLFITLS